VPLPAEGGDTVLVEPRLSARISDPLTVSGYSRNSEAANTITLIDSDGKILVRRTVLSNDRGHTWGYFEATLDLPPFSGKGTLKVGPKAPTMVPSKAPKSPFGLASRRPAKVRSPACSSFWIRRTINVVRITCWSPHLFPEGILIPETCSRGMRSEPL
jgi:hypothetical protein